MTDAGVPAGALDAHGGWPALIAALVAGEDLAPAAANAALTDILEGSVPESRIAALLVGLAAKGASAAELDGMVDAMRAAALPLDLTDVDGVVDIVGTGGAPTRRVAALNVSTMASFVAAGAGARVCKHGNRMASSTSGSMDVLEALGVGIELGPDGVRRCVDEVGIGFAFARVFHPAMRHAAPVRTALGIPTVFNLLGPLSHPGGVRRAVLGVSDPDKAAVMVDVLRRREAPRAMVVCGHDRTDELLTTGPTTVHELRDGDVRSYELDPTSLGLELVTAEEVAGGDPATNAAIANAVFAGKPGPHAELVALNAAAALVVAGVVDTLADGLDAARASIADGAAAERLDGLRTLTASLA
jgi:anthranilate phosphoribosyltransferase